MAQSRRSSIVISGFVCLALSFGISTSDAGKPEKPGKPPKPDPVEYTWHAMIVESVGGVPESTNLSGADAESANTAWEVGGVDYVGWVYVDGELARIWANHMNGRYMVLGFHVEPFNLFELSGLEVFPAPGDFDGFDCERLPCDFDPTSEDCDELRAAECVADFLNGPHPGSSDYHDVGFAFHSPYSCEFNIENQLVGSSVKMSYSLWLDALDDQCGVYHYGVHGWNDPNVDCSCDELYVVEWDQPPVALTRLDESNWLLVVDGIEIDNLNATDCEEVPINKKRSRRVPISPMDNVDVSAVSFKILFSRVALN